MLEDGCQAAVQGELPKVAALRAHHPKVFTKPGSSSYLGVTVPKRENCTLRLEVPHSKHFRR